MKKQQERSSQENGDSEAAVPCVLTSPEQDSAARRRRREQNGTPEVRAGRRRLDWGDPRGWSSMPGKAQLRKEAGSL